jgi:hypothetical protein
MNTVDNSYIFILKYLRGCDGSFEFIIFFMILGC